MGLLSQEWSVQHHDSTIVVRYTYSLTTFGGKGVEIKLYINGSKVDSSNEVLLTNTYPIVRGSLKNPTGVIEPVEVYIGGLLTPKARICVGGNTILDATLESAASPSHAAASSSIQNDYSKGFIDSIRICFIKYFDFSGRASRSEYWWFTLFVLIIGVITAMIGPNLNLFVSAATLLPSITVTCRRLHDTNRSGWLQLLGLIPIIGWAFLIVWCSQRPRPHSTNVAH